MKSFVSLLDGYYRLTEKWSFNICKDISSPSLGKLKRIKCHGPVSKEFAYNKLREKGSNNTGAYILRESMSKYNEFKLDLLIKHESFITFKIKVIQNQVFVEGFKQQFESIPDLIKNFTTFDESVANMISLTHCITPSEHDQPLNLLLCSLNTNKTQTDNASIWPPIIPTNCLKLSNTTLTNNSRYGVRLATLQHKSNVKEVIVKEVKSNEMTDEFLKTVSQWTHLRNDSIVVCKGITLNSPLSIVLEYFPIGPLDLFLKKNEPKLKTVDLIESVSCLARALWFLHENCIVHGHIRCHNLLVSHYSSNSLKVKLSDPISDNDINQERAWLPPEYFSTIECACSFKRLTHYLDVWSFGTTVWQIFSYGEKPNCDEMIELTKPIDCPNEIWLLIQECWTRDCEARKQPRSIVRDISQILYEVYNSRRTLDHYSKPIFDDKKPNKTNMFKSMFGSTTSLSSRSIRSAVSTSTYLNDSGNETTIWPEIFPPSEQNVNEPYEPWFIEINQLNLEKVIGTVSHFR
jgi:serine/threonine protein kinase